MQSYSLVSASKDCEGLEIEKSLEKELVEGFQRKRYMSYPNGALLVGNAYMTLIQIPGQENDYERNQSVSYDNQDHKQRDSLHDLESHSNDTEKSPLFEKVLRLTFKEDILKNDLLMLSGSKEPTRHGMNAVESESLSAVHQQKTMHLKDAKFSTMECTTNESINRYVVENANVSFSGPQTSSLGNNTVEKEQLPEKLKMPLKDSEPVLKRFEGF